MHTTLGFVHEPSATHVPEKQGLTLVSGRVYRDKEGALFVRLPPRDIPRYHRTGKPAVTDEYVGVPTQFTVDDVRAILKAMV